MSKPKNKQIPIALYTALVRLLRVTEGETLSENARDAVSEARAELEAWRDRREFKEG